MTEAEGDEETLNDMLNNHMKFVKLTKQPSNINAEHGTMRPYQITGLNWMVALRNAGISGILADEMGLGKTLQAISLMAYIRSVEGIDGPHLVIVPKSTIPNWSREFKNWCPEIDVCILDGDKDTRKDIISKTINPGKFEVVLLSYDICMRERAAIRKHDWEYIVVDEAHRLKNHLCKLARTLREFDSKYRLLLTGTPIQNNLRELWSLLNFLLPDVFNNVESFDSVFLFDKKTKEADRDQVYAELRKLLRPFLLRRLKANAAKEIPPKTETVLFVGMSAMQKNVYKHVLMRDFTSLLDNSAKKTSQTALLNICMQLRKAANHPYLFYGIEDRSLDPFGDHLIENSGKLFLLSKLIAKFREKGEKILLFSQMTRMLDILEDFCCAKDYEYCRLDGSTSMEDRIEQMDSFNDPDSKFGIFLLSTRAGGLGINLQAASVVILYDSDWNPQMDIQAIDRAHRIGQKKEVLVFRLICDQTVEEKMIERAEMKLRLDAMVIQKGRAPGKNKVGKNEMLEMVNYGADQIFKSGGSTITDEDIDDIIAAGKKRTEELNEKWGKKVQKKFSEFTFDGNYQVLDGVDYSDARHAKARKVELMDTFYTTLGKRKRTQINSYSVDNYYSRMLQMSQGPNTNKLKRPTNLPDFKAWQFYDDDRLYEIWEKEYEFFCKYRCDPKYDPNLKPLTDEEIAEKEKLLSEGFPLTHREFLCFMRQSCQQGAESPLVVENWKKEFPELSIDPEAFQKRWLEEASNRSELESHCGRIQDAADKRTRIKERAEKAVARKKEKAERKIHMEKTRAEWAVKKEKREKEKKERLEKINQRLINAIASTYAEYEKKKCLSSVKIPHPAQKLGYSAFDDKFLLLQTHRVGFGNWEDLHDLVERDARFHFNHLITSRTTDELRDRVLQLARAVASRNEKSLKRKLQNSDERSSKKRKTGEMPAAKDPETKMELEDEEEVETIEK